MYVVVDFETTGLDFRFEQVTEIGAIRLDENFNEVGSFHTFVRLRRGKSISPHTPQITEEMLATGVHETIAMEQLIDFIGDDTVVAQYAPFDLAFLSKFDFDPETFICTKSLSSMVEPGHSSSLGATCERLGIELVNAHRATDDARATAQVLKHRMIHDIAKFPQVANMLVVTEGRPFNFIPEATEKIYAKKSGELIADLYFY